MPKTAIVVPCFNEEKRLDTEEFVRAIDDDDSLHFIFVNDGSDDDTGPVIEKMSVDRPGRIFAVTLDINSGKAEATRRGFGKAFENGYELIGYLDADLATPLSAIQDFVAIMERDNVLMIMGSRVRLLGRDVKRSLARHYLGRLFATFASVALNLPVYDTQCGAKLFRNSEPVREAFALPFGARWVFDVEIIARLALAIKSGGGDNIEDLVIEHPLDQWRDVAGSKIKLKDFVMGAMELVFIMLRYSRKLYRAKSYSS